MHARDDITDLPDRRAFVDLLKDAVRDAGQRDTNLGLLVVDIDRFTQINVAYGYGFGDRVLAHLAARLGEVARPHDRIARVGDNRFAMILPRLMNRGHGELASQKVLRLLEIPFEHDDVRLRVPVTIGGALCPQHATHAGQLLGKAELALAIARKEDRRYGFAPDSAAAGTLSDQWDLEMELSNAIDRDELAMYYQPQVHIADRRVIGVEALMRWKNRKRGMVPPDVFIPLAERTGHIRKMTLWAMNTVLREVGQWRHEVGPLTVSVNMPSELVAHSDLPELLQNALQLFGSPSVRPMIEITERSLMAGDRVIAQLKRIRELGVRVSIDDFGTGYSCLAYFHKIPADELKIDKSFVSRLLTDTASADITMLIIDLAHRFDLDVVAEGVEDQATLDKLASSGCDSVQGYFFAKPMPAAECEAWLQRFVRADPGSSHGMLA
ncbi:MAG: bifunctional diguanylate cyclase/phosphodiesterase [Proteobacteria bacterium]|nr:bifunctional diguanylate cyclase/phosphodiesterase [Pseudomonadota bacterium]MBS0463648.1 bifunctional diguanylate cyclase/phosphodiesterase [Pseudomonadota bacterium]